MAGDAPNQGGGGRKTLTQAMQQAREFGPKLQKTAERIAKAHGATVTPLNYKSRESAQRKLDQEKRGDVSSIRDLARTTIVCDTQEQVDKVVKDLEKMKRTSRVKHQNDADSGYTGKLINVKYGDMEGEIQVNTARMIYAKEPATSAKAILGPRKYEQVRKEVTHASGRGHRLYEVARDKTKSQSYRDKANRISRKYYGNIRNA